MALLTLAVAVATLVVVQPEALIDPRGRPKSNVVYQRTANSEALLQPCLFPLRYGMCDITRQKLFRGRSN